MQPGPIVKTAYRLEPLPYSQNNREGKHHYARHYGKGRQGTGLGARIGVKCRITVEHNCADTHKHMAHQRGVASLENLLESLPAGVDIPQSDVHIAFLLSAYEQHQPAHHLTDTCGQRSSHHTHVQTVNEISV